MQRCGGEPEQWVRSEVPHVPLAGAAALGGALILAALGRLTVVDTEGIAAWAYESVIVLTAIVLAADLVLRRPLQAAATGLVVDLADRHEPQALRAALARAVGDPALAIAYRVGEQWVDEAGQPMPLPTDDRATREVTVVEDSGTPVAASCTTRPRCGTSHSRDRSPPPYGWRSPTFACKPTSRHASAKWPTRDAGS